MRLNYTWTCSVKVSCRLVMDIMSYCGQKDISAWNLIIPCTPISDTTPYICFYWRTSRSSWHLFVRMWVVKQVLMRSLMFIESNHSMRHPLYWYLGKFEPLMFRMGWIEDWGYVGWMVSGDYAISGVIETVWNEHWVSDLKYQTIHCQTWVK